MKHGGAGQNKRCDQVEKRQRIDSFEVRNRLFDVGGFRMLPFDFDGEHVLVDDGISGGDYITVSFMENASGRYPFFLCPKCGQRVRFLYIPGFLCRECSRLNYRSQQTTKGSYEAVSAIPEKLDVEIPPKDCEEKYVLPRPRYMHKNRYERYKRRFEKHLERYIEKKAAKYLTIFFQGLKGIEGDWLDTWFD